MTRARRTKLALLTVDQLEVDDERSFRHVPLYADMKEVLRRARYLFRVMPRARAPRWDRALLLNLTFWGADEGRDVLTGRRIPADVVAHAAWHHLAAGALARRSGKATAESLFLGEAIASAFDVYLVGRLLGRAPRSSFLASQVPAMAEAAAAAGASERAFAELLRGVAADPERAFADLRALLFDATTALHACADAEAGLAAMARFDRHRFAPILHHYELSNWVLYARAYGSSAPDPRARAIDRALRREKRPLQWLAKEWILRALLAVLLVVAPSVARAQGSYGSTPKGGRSALMGNTGVALARDGSAPFLNPATIMRIDDVSLAFSVNLYSFTLSHYSNWHAPGTVDPRFGVAGLMDTSLSESRFDVIPSTFCLFYTLGTPDGADQAKKGRQKLAVCLGSVERDQSSFPAINYRSLAAGVTANQAQSVSRGWTRFQAGPTYSANLSDDLAIGVSLHGIYTIYDAVWSTSSVTVDASGRGLDSSLDASADGRSLDLAALVGITYRLSPITTFGVSAQTPSFHLGGAYDANIHSQYSGAGTHASFAAGTGTFVAPPPMRIAAGLGAEWPRFKIEVDETLYAPMGEALRSSTHVDTVAVDDGRAGATSTDTTFSARSNAVVNSAIGAEYFMTPALSLLGGFSTDFSAAPRLLETQPPNLGLFYQERMNRATVSLGIGSYGDASDLLFGTELAYGWGKALAVNNYALGPEFAVVDKSTFSVIAIIAGNASLKAIQRTLRGVKDAVKPKEK